MQLHEDKLANKLRQGHEAIDGLHRKLDRYLNGSDHKHTDIKMLQHTQNHYYRPGWNAAWQARSDRFSASPDWTSAGLQTASTRAPDPDRLSRGPHATDRHDLDRQQVQGVWPANGPDGPAGTVESHSNRPVPAGRPAQDQASGFTDRAGRNGLGPRPDDTLSAYGINGAEHSNIPGYMQNSRLFPNGTDPLLNQNTSLRKPVGAGKQPSSMLVTDGSQDKMALNPATKRLSEPFVGTEKAVNRSAEYSDLAQNPTKASDLKVTNPRRVQVPLIRDSSRDGLSKTQLIGSLGRLALLNSKQTDKTQSKSKRETFAQKIKREKLKAKREKKKSRSPAPGKDLKSTKRLVPRPSPKQQWQSPPRSADKLQSSAGRRLRDRKSVSAGKTTGPKHASHSQLKARPRPSRASQAHSLTHHRAASTLADISGLRLARDRFGLNPVETGVLSYLFMRDKLYPNHRNHIDVFLERLALNLRRKPKPLEPAPH